MKQPRIAIATEFLEQYGGAQKVLEAISEMYPEAPIYTAKFNKKVLETAKVLKNRTIVYPQNKWTNILAKHFFVFAMAPIFENYNFKDYDVVVSDGTTWTKGIITNPDQLHITYVHTPPRFLYGYSKEGNRWERGVGKLFYSYMLNLLRMWDFVAAQRPDFIIANSNEVQKRIKKFYNRDSLVIYPPVETTLNKKEIKTRNQEYYLALGRLSKYKNFDKVIQAFNQTKLNLVVAGTGFEEKELKKLAKGNIEFVGKISDEEKNYLLENCKGVVNAVQDEDFGIVPVEAHMHGKPVLAHNSGGHKETIIENTNGMFFEDLTKDVVLEFDKKIEDKKFNKEKIKTSAEKYSIERFKNELSDFITKSWEKHLKQNA